MSNSKKSGSLHRITITFTMNDDGCSVPELAVTRDAGQDTEITLIPFKDLSPEQQQAISMRLILAGGGWVSHITSKHTWSKASMLWARFHWAFNKLDDSLRDVL